MNIMCAAMVNVVDFYLDPSKPADVQTLVSKSRSQGPLDAKDEALLQGYILEALRTYLFCYLFVQRSFL